MKARLPVSLLGREIARNKLMDQFKIPINSLIMLNANRISPEKYLATYVRTAKHFGQSDRVGAVPVEKQRLGGTRTVFGICCRTCVASWQE